jgi:NAD(P)-dependent dehydrogenase (short-subunit alcohol dehydrogenase family)
LHRVVQFYRWLRADILVNNAGISAFDDLSDRRLLEQQLAVNLFGPYDVTQAFLPLLMGTWLRRHDEYDKTGSKNCCCA